MAKLAIMQWIMKCQWYFTQQLVWTQVYDFLSFDVVILVEMWEKTGHGSERDSPNLRIIVYQQRILSVALIALGIAASHAACTISLNSSNMLLLDEKSTDLIKWQAEALIALESRQVKLLIKAGMRSRSGYQHAL
ncbi:hypothetical protein LTR51_005019 [Lithohypha guttulata]|nr:hypothetical protein LTR51_005019 [Lithohypha guttulata]